MSKLSKPLNDVDTYFKISKNEFLYSDTDHTHLSEDGYITVCGKNVDENWWIVASNSPRSSSNCVGCLHKTKEV